MNVKKSSRAGKESEKALYEQGKRFFQLFQRLLQKNRFVRKLTATGLSRAEIHVVIELAARGFCTVSDLTTLLSFEQSSVSRLIQGLAARKFVSVKASATDKRVKEIRLTEKGKGLIDKIDNVAGGLFSDFASHLSVAERAKLAAFFKEIGDLHEEVPGHPRKGEELLRMEQRRLSRAFGMLGQGAFGSALSPTQWHVLAESEMRVHPLTGKEVCYLLGLTPANLSLVLDKLAVLGYIKREKSAEDSRKVLITPTAAGKRTLHEVESLFVERLMPLLEVRTTAETEELLELLQRYVGEGKAVELVLNSLPGSYKVIRLKAEEDLKKARTYTVTKLVTEKLLEHLPETVISKHSLVFSLIHDDDPARILAVAEYQRGEEGVATLTLGASSSSLPKNLLFGFLARCEEMMKISHQISMTSCSFEPFLKIK